MKLSPAIFGENFGKWDAKSFCSRGYMEIHAENLKLKLKGYLKLWNEKYPERVKAHRTLNAAVQRGIIKKPKNCQRCGRYRNRIYGHHADYTKPLQVEWLCGRCHLAGHGMKV